MITTTFQSQNKKLVGNPSNPRYSGKPIAATTRAVGAIGSGTCPSTCGMLSASAGGTREGGGGCYATGGPVSIIQRRSTYDVADGEKIQTFIEMLPKSFVLRHHVAGDIGLNGAVDLPYVEGIRQGHLNNPELVGFGFTHFWRDIAADTFRVGKLSMNASCESHEEVKQALAAGWKVATVVPTSETRRSWIDDGVHYVACPAEKTGIGCRDCGICANADRKVVVAFRAHGSGKKRVDTMLAGLTALPMASD